MTTNAPACGRFRPGKNGVDVKAAYFQRLSTSYVGQAKTFASKMQRADALVKKNVERDSDFGMVVDRVVAVAVIPGSTCSAKKTPNDCMRYGVIWKDQVRKSTPRAI